MSEKKGRVGRHEANVGDCDEWIVRNSKNKFPAERVLAQQLRVQSTARSIGLQSYTPPFKTQCCYPRGARLPRPFLRSNRPFGVLHPLVAGVAGGRKEKEREFEWLVPSPPADRIPAYIYVRYVRTRTRTNERTNERHFHDPARRVSASGLGCGIHAGNKGRPRLR